MYPHISCNFTCHASVFVLTMHVLGSFEYIVYHDREAEQYTIQVARFTLVQITIDNMDKCDGASAVTLLHCFRKATRSEPARAAFSHKEDFCKIGRGEVEVCAFRDVDDVSGTSDDSFAGDGVLDVELSL